MKAILKTVKRWSALLVVLGALPTTIQALDEAAIQEEVTRTREWLKQTRFKDKPLSGLEGEAQRLGRLNYLRNLVANGDVVTFRKLLEEDLTFATSHFYDLGGTPLLVAAEANRPAMVELLLSHKDALVQRGLVRSNFAWENEALLLAAKHGSKEVVEVLLTAQADKETADWLNRSPLSLAVPHPNDHWAYAGTDKARDARRMATAKLLVERGANLFTVCGRESPMSPLQAAIQTKQGEWVDLLLTNTTRLTATDINGNSLLHLAATSGRDRAMLALLAKSADVQATNKLGLTPLQTLASLTPWASESSMKEFAPLQHYGLEDRHANADLLLAHGAKLDIFSAVALGKSEAVDLLKQQPARAQARDAQGCTPLHWAARAGERGMVEILLKYRASVQAQDRENRLPLHDALERRHFRIAERLLDVGSPVNVKDQRGRTPLHYAAESGQLPLVEQMLVVQADVKAVDARGKTPLHLAAEFGHQPVAERLLTAGADINAKDAQGNTALDVATRQNQEPIVRLLVARGSAIKTGGRRVTTPLHSAVVAGNVALIKEMLNQEVDINAQNADGKTALLLACERDNLPLMDLLLNAGADINAPDKDGNTVLHYRMRAAIDLVPVLPPPDSLSDRLSKKLGVSNPLKRFNSPPSAPAPPPVPVPNRVIIRPASPATPVNPPQPTGPIILTNFLRGPLPPPRQTGAPPTAIGVNISGTRRPWGISLEPNPPPPTQSILKYLLDHKADVQAVNLAQQSPLHLIVDRPDTWNARSVKLADEMVTALLASGLRIDAADRTGMTALHLAASRGNTTWADLLLKHKANPNARDKSGRTPLLIAIGTPHIVSLLMTNKADVNLADHAGRTPLHLAAPLSREKMAVITVLLTHNPDVNTQDKEGRTPVHMLLTSGWPFEGRDAAIHALAAVGANVNLQDNAGRTPVQMLLTTPWPYHGVGAALDVLLAVGADVNLRDQAGQTAVHYLSRMGDAHHWMMWTGPLAARIVNDKAAVNVADKDGNTPLHLAASTGRAELTALLIGKKADATLRNKAGVTPLYYAELASPAINVTPLLPPGAKADIFQSAASGDLASLEILLRAEPKLAQITNRYRSTPLLMAANGGHQAAADLLLNAGAVMDSYSAAALGRVTDLATALKQNPELARQPIRNTGPETLLHRAAQSGQAASVKLLLEYQADLQAVDVGGHTPLFRALTDGHATTADLLRAKGAQENIFDAVALNHPNEVKILLVGSPSLVEITNWMSHTPLHRAVFAGNREITALLLAHHAPVNAPVAPFMPVIAELKNVRGLTALHLAAWSNRRDLAELLLAAGAETEVMDWSGYTPLHYACFYGHQALAELLLTHKARANAQWIVTNHPPGTPAFFGPSGNTPLHVAAQYGCTNLVELLLAHGANINAVNNLGHTPLSKVNASIRRGAPYLFGESHSLSQILPTFGLPPERAFASDPSFLPNYPAPQKAAAALLVRHGAKEPKEPSPFDENGFPRSGFPFGGPPGLKIPGQP